MALFLLQQMTDEGAIILSAWYCSEGKAAQYLNAEKVCFDWLAERTTVQLIREQCPHTIASQNCIFMNELLYVVFHCFSPCVVIYCCAKKMKSNRCDLVSGLAGERVLEAQSTNYTYYKSRWEPLAL